MLNANTTTIDVGWADIWESIVSAYTIGELTKPSDKLPAISSIAKKIRLIAKDQYVVGLWRSVLPRQLLWRSIEPKARKPLPKVYRAPSVRTVSTPSYSWLHRQYQPCHKKSTDLRSTVVMGGN